MLSRVPFFALILSLYSYSDLAAGSSPTDKALSCQEMERAIDAATAGWARHQETRALAKTSAKGAFKPCAGGGDESALQWLSQPSENAEQINEEIRKITNEATQKCRERYHDPTSQKVFDEILSSSSRGGGANRAACSTQSSHLNGARENAKSGGVCGGAALSCTTALNKIKERCNQSGSTSCAVIQQELNKGLNTCKSQYQESVRHFTDAGKFSESSQKAAEIAKKSGQECPPPEPGGDKGGGSEGDKTETAGGEGQQPGGDSQAAQAGPGSGMGGMNPMAMMGPLMQALGKGQQGQEQQPQMPQQAMEQPFDSVDCSVNPNLAGCPQAPKNDSWNRPAGDLSASGAEGNDGNFNLGNPSDSVGGPSESMNERSIAPPMTVNGIPNGGGGMPGGGGGGPATLGSSGGGGGAGNAGSKADILHGERGGGGYSALAESMNMQSGGGGGGYTYGPNGDSGSGYENMDLKQYLPGGKQDPNRRLAGIGGNSRNEIMSREVNIWNRISDRIRTRCLQGLLRDCVP